ncbi:MAG: hypothetical protein ACD_46C00135G0002 [uncultured bacterium]|nr:MAG: hypothetical protein ACD_46C00135G0002 [uncultured bacterium]
MRIISKPENEYSLFSRFMFWLQKRKFGTVLEPTKIWGRSSWLYFGFNIFYAAIVRKSSPLEPALISLVNTRVAQINHCPFCIDLNSSFLQKQGITLEKIIALSDFETSELFTEKERIALSYAEAMTKTDKGVDDDLFQKLQKFFSENEIIELTATIAFENLSSKFNAALAIPAQGLCQLPQNNDKK